MVYVLMCCNNPMCVYSDRRLAQQGMERMRIIDWEDGEFGRSDYKIVEVSYNPYKIEDVL